MLICNKKLGRHHRIPIWKKVYHTLEHDEPNVIYHQDILKAGHQHTFSLYFCIRAVPEDDGDISTCTEYHTSVIFK